MDGDQDLEDMRRVIAALRVASHPTLPRSTEHWRSLADDGSAAVERLSRRLHPPARLARCCHCGMAAQAVGDGHPCCDECRVAVHP